MPRQPSFPHVAELQRPAPRTKFDLRGGPTYVGAPARNNVQTDEETYVRHASESDR